MANSIAVVIPTYGAARLPVLRRTLQSLVGVPRPAGFEGIWLVENGPLAGAQAVCDEFASHLPDLRYLHEPQLGLSAARNAGVRASQSDYLIFFDNDVRVGGDILNAYARAFDQYGPGCFYGGAVYPECDEPPPQWLHPYLPPSVVYRHLADRTGPIEKPLLLGGNHALSRAALESVGGYDSIAATGARGGMGEETRLQEAIAATGGQLIYIADAPVWHYVPVAESSTQWALNRKFRDGLTEGLLQVHAGPRRLFGAPRWIWRRWLMLVMRCAAARLAGRNLQQRFDLEVERAHFAGLVAGYRQSATASR
jgi:glycosyltransferase involved in cell wall biosynthesis